MVKHSGTRTVSESIESDRGGAGVARGGAGTGCVWPRDWQVPLALQRGDRHRVQANKPNTTSSTALQNFTSALS